MIEPRWIGRPATKPGYGEVVPTKQIHTCDAPEKIAICLDCPFPRCKLDSSNYHTACPLEEMRPASTKRGKPRDPGYQQLDERVEAMAQDGMGSKDICGELQIGADELRRSKRRIRERKRREERGRGRE